MIGGWFLDVRVEGWWDRPKVDQKQGPSGQKPGMLKSGPKVSSKVSPNKRAPQTDFIHAGLAQIDFKGEFAKVVKNPLGGAPRRQKAES